MVPAGGGQGSTVRAEGYLLDPGSMSGKDVERGATGGVPEPNGIVETARSQHPTVRREGYGIAPARCGL